VYDMYPWNETDSGASHDQDQNTPARLPAPRNSAPRNSDEPRDGTRHADGNDVPADLTQAVQFALDRRDNGGDAVPAGQPAVSPTRQ
jgi:hypothetical protein